MKKITSIVFLYFLLSFSYAQQINSINDLLVLFGKTESSLPKDKSFYNENGIGLDFKELNDTNRVYRITLSVNPNLKYFKNKPFKSPLPNNLNSEMNFKQALKVLKKQDDVEILLKDKKHFSITYLWKVANPYNDIDPARKIKGMGYDGILVEIEFNAHKPGNIYRIKITARHDYLSELGRKIYLSK
jgi:hypothetical protein